MATIEKRGTRYRVKIRRKGHAEVQRSFATRAESEKFQRSIETQIDRSEYVDTRLADRMTLADALRRYRDTVTPTKKSAPSELSKIAVWLRHEMASRPLGKITAADLIKWKEGRIADGAKSSTIRNLLSLVSQVFVTADSEWMIPVANPVARVKLPPLDRARDRRLSDAEAKKLNEWLVETERYRGGDDPLSGHPADRWCAMLVRLALATTARASELAGLKWKDVDWGRRTIMARDTKGIAGRDRNDRGIPLSSVAINTILFGPVYDIEEVLPPKNANSITQAWERVRARLGMDDMRFHDIRHEATARLFETTRLRDIEIAAITGHKTLGMTKRYANLRAADLAPLLD